MIGGGVRCYILSEKTACGRGQLRPLAADQKGVKKMGYGITVEAWGDYALFSRPELKVERVSYDVITPSAARGLIEAVYFKPAIRWKIDRIVVCNPIAFTNIRRNEVKSKLSVNNARSAMNGTADMRPLFTAEDIQQRASMVLRDVRYIIEAHFELTVKAGETDTAEKHYNIALRRLRNGQFFHQPCFGCREFPANFRLFEGDADKEGVKESRDLGLMLYDLNYSNPREIRPMFFRAVMRNGVIDLRDCEVLQ